MNNLSISVTFFFFNDTATTEIYTLSLHDALPICLCRGKSASFSCSHGALDLDVTCERYFHGTRQPDVRSEEHTSELQSQSNLVCRLLLEKKKKNHNHVNVGIDISCHAIVTQSYLC